MKRRTLAEVDSDQPRKGAQSIMQRQPFNVDLASVARRALKGPLTAGWSPERLDAAVEEYRRFMQLCHGNPSTKISAPPDVDVIWHTHIEDTARYRADCSAYFGYFLDHDVCDGEEPDTASFDHTVALYAQTFGAPAPKLWHEVMTCAAPGGGCGSIRRDTIGATGAVHA